MMIVAGLVLGSLSSHAWHKTLEHRWENRTQRGRTRSHRLPCEAAQSASRVCPPVWERRPCNAHPRPVSPWRTTASLPCCPNQRDRPRSAWRVVACPFNSSRRDFPRLEDFILSLRGWRTGFAFSSRRPLREQHEDTFGVHRGAICISQRIAC